MSAASVSPPDTVAGRRAGAALAVLVTCQMMLVLDATIVTIALPRMQTSLRFSTAGLTWVVSAYTLAFGGLLLLGGRVGDLAGRRRSFITGVLVFTAASLAAGLAPNAAALLAARAAQGVGAAFAAPGALSLLAVTFPDGPQRTRALSVFSTVSAVGLAVGQLLGGVLTAAFGWRSVFFVNVPFGLLIAAVAPRVVAETPRVRGRFDLAGALSSTAGATALVYGLVTAARRGWLDPMTLGLLAGSVVLLVAFVLVERRAEQPITPLRLFTDRYRLGAFVQRFVITAAMVGGVFFLSLYVQHVMGYGPLLAALSFLPSTVTGIVAGRYAHKLVGRFRARAVVAAGGAVSTVALLWLALRAGQHTGFVDTILGPTALLGAGNLLVAVAVTVVALEQIPPADSGAASATLQAMQQVGGSFGVAVLAAVFGGGRAFALTGAGQSSAMAHAFLAGAVLSLLCLLLALAGVGADRPAASAAR